MKTSPVRSVILFLRALFALLLCAGGIWLAALGLARSNDGLKPGRNVQSIAWMRPTLRDPLMPPAISQPILATFDWVASFQGPTAPRMTAMSGAMTPRRISQGTRRGAALPVVSDAVPAIPSPALRDLPAANVHSVWVEQPEPKTPASR